MLPQKRWKILNQDPDLSLLDILLQNRNLTQEHLQDFRLSEKLHDPYLLKDMDIAVNRIMKAIKEKKQIVIFGDYDVDGIVSTVILKKFFEKVGIDANYIFPSRHRDGYGLKPQGVGQAIELGADLLITVDNGISSHDAIEEATKHNIDVIITDHHIQETKLPAAIAVINPNRKDCTYPFKGICGAGVVYKLIQALSPNFFDQDAYREFMLANLDLLAMAIIADVAPIRDENYALLKFGLKSLTRTMRPGITELKRVSGLLGKPITPTAVGYYLGPRLNAAGRLKDASLAADLLLTNSREKAAQIALELNKINSQRQELQQSYMSEAIKEIESSEFNMEKIFIVENPEWDSGLIGILSGKLKDRYYRPVLAFTGDKDGNYVGSARSINNFHITQALSRFKELFINFGGHEKAAGLTISGDNFIEFKKLFKTYVTSELEKKDLVQALTIDSVIHAQSLNTAIVEMIDQIGPYGEGNPQPVLALMNVKVTDLRMLSEDKHIKLYIQSGNSTFECIWWGQGGLKDEIKFGSHIDIAFKPQINLWNNTAKLQLIVEDISPV
jgi:single-stranded-DNA-specific exonuclease